MSTALVRAESLHQPPSQATACLAILCSPIRGADGTWRVLREQVDAGQCLSAVLPPRLTVERLIVNGGVVDPAAYGSQCILPGDDILVIPRWGEPGTLTALLVTAAIGLAVSAAATALSFVLFPPPKAHNIQPQPEEPSFGFEGIRTAIGPGAPVPVIYGRQRVGGQLLSSAVDQTLTVREDSITSRRVRAVSAPATLSLLLALGEGAVGTIDPATIQINGQPIANFPTVEVHTNLGTLEQAPLPYFGETANTFSDGRALAEAPLSIVYTTTQPIHAFVLNIAFLNGLVAFSPKGEKVDNMVTLQYRYRPVGTQYSIWWPFDVEANRTSVVRFGIRRENLPFAAYDIELQLTFASASVTTNAAWVPTLESVTEIQSNTQAYPWTACVGLRALATDTLQGALPNVTIEVQGRRVRVGSFAVNESYSDNPAWCVMDFLTNTRYGLAIPDSQIDLGAFQAWANYCDELIDGEKRHVLNYTLDRDIRAQQALLEMMGGSRTILLKSEGLWTPRPTRNDVPVQLLSWANCTDLKLTYTRDPDRINVIEARFANEALDFEQDVLTWPAIENWPPDVRKTSLELRGVTKPSRVMRAMQFELNRRRFENLSLEMTCSLDAVVLQPHDLFRFSHPLPGWGTSGRLQAGSTTSLLSLDNEVGFSGLQSYIVYVRHEDGTTEVRPVSYPGDVTARTLTLLTPLSQVPMPRTSLWAFGALLGPADTATKVFRVIRMQRLSDTTVRLQAMIHNPSIYDEPVGIALPLTTSLFNPLGPPPPLTSLVLTEVSRIQSSGASMRVVNLSWDIAGLGTGHAPYGGALIQRRTVTSSASGGQAGMGAVGGGEIQGSTDGLNNFQPLTQVSGHILDWDDYTIVTGTTYVYRVIPVSARGVPNIPGAREATIHVAGPTTPGYFPGTVLNLRLKGKLPTDTIFEGPDAHFEWDPIGTSTLFTETFYIADYVVEIWAPGQLYLMRRTIVAARGVGITLDYSYTLQYNIEDQVRAGQQGARRDFTIMVWARTNTGLLSATPASLTVFNPPPDMSDMIPDVDILIEGARISFDQFFEPRDFDHYVVFIDTVTPPIAIYEDVAIGPQGFGRALRRIYATNLTPGVTYYTFVLPFDTFGPGLPTHIVSFVPTSITGDWLDQTPPAVPSGLALTTGTTLNPDGTVMTWVEARWNANADTDISSYDIQFFVGTSTDPTSFTVLHPTTSIRLDNVGGGVTIRVKLLARDKLSNASAYTAEATITTGQDTAPPAPPDNLLATGYTRSVALLWTPPADLDYSHCNVYANQTNAFDSSSIVGTGHSNFLHGGLQANATWYYWLKSVDTSGNESVLPHPASFTAGVQGIADLLQSDFIASLVANKITTGTLTALVSIGVAGRIYLDGINNFIYVADDALVTRVRMGKLGVLSTDYGLQVFNAAGVQMFRADTGVTAAGITAGIINAQHLRTDTAVITTSLQLPQGAFAVIDDAHINTLSVNKLITGTLDVLAYLGVGQRLMLDGANANIHVYDLAAEPRLRAMFGQLGPGAQEFGLRLWNAAGDLMWDFNTGSSTFGIQDLAVTNAKIANLTVTKLLAGSLNVLMQVGVGANLFIDGPNSNLYVYDAQTPQQPRVLLGKIGTGVDPTEYGLQIYDTAGQVMWSFTTGAQTRGITPFAVSESVQYFASGELASTVTETIAASLTFPSLDAGDQVWVTAMATGRADATEHIDMRLREDGTTGALMHQSIHTGPGEASIGVQGVYTAPAAQVNKTFVATFKERDSAGTVQLYNMVAVGLRRRR